MLFCCLNNCLLFLCLHTHSYLMQACDEEKLLGHLGVVLYEYLGEEYPEVLGSILGALKAIVNVIGMTKMTPPIKDLLPRLTPILKNRHEKVQFGFCCCDRINGFVQRWSAIVIAVGCCGTSLMHTPLDWCSCCQVSPVSAVCSCRCKRTALIWWGVLQTEAQSMCQPVSGCESVSSCLRC